MELQLTRATRAQAHTIPKEACGLPCTHRAFCAYACMRLRCVCRAFEVRLGVRCECVRCCTLAAAAAVAEVMPSELYHWGGMRIGSY